MRFQASHLRELDTQEPTTAFLAFCKQESSFLRASSATCGDPVMFADQADEGMEFEAGRSPLQFRLWGLGFRGLGFGIQEEHASCKVCSAAENSLR